MLEKFKTTYSPIFLAEDETESQNDEVSLSTKIFLIVGIVCIGGSALGVALAEIM